VRGEAGMKVDPRNPRHWLWLGASALWASVAILLRPFRRRTGRLRVLLYGHKLGGNLLALHRGLRDDPDFKVAFLSLDPGYATELAAAGESAVCAASWRCVKWLATADALVSDHGLHALEPMLHLTDLRFFDTWHGIPFKGFDREDFRVQRHYQGVWVASDPQRDLWVGRFGFDPGIVEATGYPRTDRLVRHEDRAEDIRRELGLDPGSSGKIVLFAPTWRQDDAGRSVFPFGTDADGFLGELSSLAARCDATILLRTHLNSDTPGDKMPPRVVAIPYARFPDTEAILLASDVLVCDWSSIAFDFLLLSRPTIFLDVPAPFAKGFSLGQGYRFGAIAGDLAEMVGLLESYLHEPAAYDAAHGANARRIRDAVYGDRADGLATARCLERLRRVRS
jgi:CDP-glycerol glycerophosphotransferase